MTKLVRDYSGDEDDAADEGQPRSPETRLARAIVAQAFVDGFISSDIAIGATEKGVKNDKELVARVAARVRSQARRFLVARSGPWRQSREHISSMADLCPDRVRSAALGLIAAQERGQDVRKLLGRVVPMAPASFAEAA